jgi:dihydrodipicolinate synthase/N-acetylneuraminate lyase
MPVQLRGILAAVTTPFTADGSAVDEPVIKTQGDRLVAAGIHGLVPTGTTGDFMTLTPTEYRRVVELYVQAAAGRVPVVAGVGALSTKDAVELARDFEQLGADAIMIVQPFYDPLDFPTLKAFLTAVSDAITVPIVYYNVPGATGIRLTANEIAELGDIERVDYPKDTSGDAVALADLLASRGDRIKAFNGWDTLTFFGIASGAEASVLGCRRCRARAGRHALGDAGRVGRPRRRRRAMEAPVGDQRLPRAGQLRRRRQGRAGAERRPEG